MCGRWLDLLYESATDFLLPLSTVERISTGAMRPTSREEVFTAKFVGTRSLGAKKSVGEEKILTRALFGPGEHGQKVARCSLQCVVKFIGEKCQSAPGLLW